MAGNTQGKLFTVTTFGESHGPGLGCIVDGCPPGLALTEDDIQADVERRRTGRSRHTSQRKETDAIRIMSGVFEGRTTGTPIGMIVENEDQRPRDYSEIMDRFRPGHADYTYQQKFGFRDYRGGGRSSARETVMRVAAGAIARKYLRERLGIRIYGYLAQLGPLVLDPVAPETVDDNPFFCPDPSRVEELENYMDALRKSRDSVGARVVTIATGVPPGLGEPEHRDEITADGFLSNHAGGVLGGISSGQDLVVSIALKPTSSIPTAGRTVDVEGNEVEVLTKGRHDPCVGLRATPIAEAQLALVVMDHYLRQRGQNADVRSVTPVVRG